MSVFLGGLCKASTWRYPIIAALNLHKISYYNPQRAVWVPEMMDEEKAAIRNANILVFVLDVNGESAGPVSRVEAECYKMVEPDQTIIVSDLRVGGGIPFGELEKTIVHTMRSGPLPRIEDRADKNRIAKCFALAKQKVDMEDDAMRLSAYLHSYDQDSKPNHMMYN